MKIKQNYEIERGEMLSIIESDPTIKNYFMINPSLFEVHFDYYVRDEIFYTNVINFDTHYIIVENDHYIFRVEYFLKYGSALSYNNVLTHNPIVDIIFNTKSIKGKHCTLKHKDKTFYSDKKTALKIYKMIVEDLEKIRRHIISKLDLSDFDSVKRKAVLIGDMLETKQKKNYNKYIKTIASNYNVNVNTIVSNNDTTLFVIFNSDISAIDNIIKKLLNRFDQYTWAIDDKGNGVNAKCNNDIILEELSLFGHGKLYLNGNENCLSF